MPSDALRELASSLDMDESREDLPLILGLFVTAFDTRKGHEIVWQRSEIDLAGCEYKTLPSGIDRVQEDVIYFTHGSCIGLAVYRNLQRPGTARDRISCFSVALLVHADSVNLRHQRLNQIWLYNSVLKDLSLSFDPAMDDHPELERLYEKRKGSIDPSIKVARKSHSPPASPIMSRQSTFRNYQSFRSERQAIQAKEAVLLPTHELSNLHPVLSLHDCISFFGPLIFPVFRYALARKRILLITNGSVQRACHFIYNIQLLSAIPNQASTMRRPSPLRQLFCFGLNDIQMLQSLQVGGGDNTGWIGVTTDKVFESKTELWDLVIKLPPESSTKSLAEERARPTLFTKDGRPVKPSYLDALNFDKLRPYLPMFRGTGLQARPRPSWKRSLVDNLVSGFWYWASAGQSLELDGEDHHHEEMEAIPVQDTTVQIWDEESAPLIENDRAAHISQEGVANGRDEVFVLVLFHRLTAKILSMLEELSCESLNEIAISREQMVRVGLTPRLQSDVQCIEDLAMRWYGREVVVDKSFWPCC